MILRLKSVLMVCGGHFHKVVIVLGAWPKAKAVLNVLTWLSCGCRPFFLGTWAAVLRRGQLSLLLPVSGHWKTIKALWTFGAYCILETTFSECSGSETMCTVIFYVKLSELMLYWMIPILMISFIRTSFWALGVETQPFLESARFLFCLYSLVKSQSGEALVQSP